MLKVCSMKQCDPDFLLVYKGIWGKRGFSY